MRFLRRLSSAEMLKQLVKSILGRKYTALIRRVKWTLIYAKKAWRDFSWSDEKKREKDAVLLFRQTCRIERAMAANDERWLNAVKYSELSEILLQLLESGARPDNFNISHSAAILKTALSTLQNHDDEKSKLESIITKYNVPQNIKAGSEIFPVSEILRHTDFDFHGFVSSRHSVRKFKDKIIPRKVIYDIVRDAEYYPTACNRQPCKVYFSEDKAMVDEIIKLGADSVVSKGIHDCLIVTSDRSLLDLAELNDQEYINGGIFLGYLVMSIHAHGLGACLFQFLQVSKRQDTIKRRFRIKDSEVIIAFVGIGEMCDEVSCACSQRRPAEDVAVCLDD